MRWNSATSIGHTLSTLAPSSRHNSILITALLETFSTPNFKVRLQSVAAITQLPRASYGTPEQFSVLLTRIELACEEIKLEFSSKESAHLTSLRIQVRGFSFTRIRANSILSSSNLVEFIYSHFRFRFFEK